MVLHSKFDTDEEVWFMKNNKPAHAKIWIVRAETMTDTPTVPPMLREGIKNAVTYQFYNPYALTAINMDLGKPCIVAEKDVFKTREELIASL